MTHDDYQDDHDRSPSTPGRPVQRGGTPGSFLRAVFNQGLWSLNTFGPADRTRGVLDHAYKELEEISADPLDVGEWIDLVILAIDGALRAAKEQPALAGFPRLETTYEAAIRVVAAYQAKMQANQERVWPDWRYLPTDKAIEHDRSAE